MNPVRATALHLEQMGATPFPHITLNRRVREFPTLERYWNDPAFRTELEAERAVEQGKINLQITGSIERFWERQRVRREVNEAFEIMADEAIGGLPDTPNVEKVL